MERRASATPAPTKRPADAAGGGQAIGPETPTLSHVAPPSLLPSPRQAPLASATDASRFGDGVGGVGGVEPEADPEDEAARARYVSTGAFADF